MSIYIPPGCTCRTVVQVTPNRKLRRQLKRLGKTAATVYAHADNCMAGGHPGAFGIGVVGRVRSSLKENTHG